AQRAVLQAREVRDRSVKATLAPPLRRRARTWRGVLPALLALVGTALAAGAVGAQDAVVLQRQADYEAALRSYQARHAAWEAQELEVQSALDEISAAKLSGNRERQEAAYQRGILQSGELQRLR